MSFALAVTLMALVANQPCPQQTYPAIPTNVDAAKIAVDPSSSPAGQKLYLGTVTIAVGQTARFSGRACDEDGDVFQMTASKGKIVLNADGTYTVEYTPSGTLGMDYINISATDVRATGDSKTRTGTIVVVTVPANRAPVLY